MNTAAVITRFSGSVLKVAFLSTVLAHIPIGTRHLSAEEGRDLCPQGYAIFQDYCLNALNGDVINPRPPPFGQHATQPAAELPPACVSPDRASWALIERHGEAQSLPQPAVAAAFFEIMDARRACRAGRSEEALAVYARVAARLATVNR